MNIVRIHVNLEHSVATVGYDDNGRYLVNDCCAEDFNDTMVDSILDEENNQYEVALSFFKVMSPAARHYYFPNVFEGLIAQHKEAFEGGSTEFHLCKFALVSQWFDEPSEVKFDIEIEIDERVNGPYADYSFVIPFATPNRNEHGYRNYLSEDATRFIEDKQADLVDQEV